MFPKPETNVSLTAYNGTSILCKGSISLPCKDKASSWLQTKFYVVDVAGPAVQGLPTCTKLNIWKLNFSVEQQKKPVYSIKDLLQLYPNQFDHIGNFHMDVKLHLKENVEPYINASRKWPIHLKEKIKIELEKMEQQSIIRRVKEHTD